MEIFNPKMTDREHSECLEETLQELRQDAKLLGLALMGSQVSIDDLTLDCLLRLADYLNQHINDITVLCKRYCGQQKLP